MNPLTVLHVNTERGWRGGEAQTLMLADGLLRRGHACLIAARRGGALASRAAGSGLEVVELPMRGEFDPSSIFGLRRLLRSRRPDLVHSHTSHAVTLVAAARFLAGPSAGGAPAVLTRRVSFSLKRNPLASLKYRLGAAHAIAVSEGVRWVLVSEGIPPDKVSVIHSAVDLERFEGIDDDAGGAIRAELGVGAAETLVGTVGALVQHKGQRFLVEAFASMAGKRPGLHLVIVGEGRLREDLESRAPGPLSGRLHLTGARSDVPAIMRALDAFALPSVSGEGSPAVVKEAMACGVPVVATDLDGVREIVSDGNEALLVPPGDSGLLAGALARVLDDGDLARELTGRARVRVREFSVSRMVDHTEEVYARVLETAAGKRAAA